VEQDQKIQTEPFLHRHFQHQDETRNYFDIGRISSRETARYGNGNVPEKVGSGGMKSVSRGGGQYWNYSCFYTNLTAKALVFLEFQGMGYLNQCNQKNSKITCTIFK
jgi:hypothetical protein